MTATMGQTPSGATQAALAAGEVSGAQTGPAMSQIASQIAMGLLPTPTSAQGWQDLVTRFTAQGQPTDASSATPTLQQLSNPMTPGSTPKSTTTAPTISTTGGLDSFLAAIKSQESNGNYQATNASSGASGAYQFMQGTWTSEAKAAGYPQYADGPASAAPANVQDAVAAHMANGYFQSYGSWQSAAEAWYGGPGAVGTNESGARAIPRCSNTRRA